MRMTNDRNTLYYKQKSIDQNIIVVINLSSSKPAVVPHVLEKHTLIDFKVIESCLVYLLCCSDGKYRLYVRSLKKSSLTHQNLGRLVNSQLLESVKCIYTCFDLSPDQKYVVYGGTKSVADKLTNILSVETFSISGDKIDSMHNTFTQSTSISGSLYMVQVIQAKVDKKTKNYYILYTTRSATGIHLVSLSTEDNKLILSQLFSTEKQNISFDRGLLTSAVANSTAAIVCDNKVIQITVKPRARLTAMTDK